MKTKKVDLDLKLKMEEILEAKLEAMEDKMERKFARIEKKVASKVKNIEAWSKLILNISIHI